MGTSLAESLSDRDSQRLRDLGFRKVNERYEPKLFGNSYVDFENDLLCLRFVRDRGQVFAEVASLIHPEEWLPLPGFLNVLGVVAPLPLWKDDGQELVRRVHEFLANYKQVAELIAPDRYEDTKQRLNELAFPSGE